MASTGSAAPRVGDIRIVIVGAGFAGICAALRLHAAGHRNIAVYERAPDVGGTWLANSYPGVACDAPSHVYSYSFAQDVDWSRRFAPGAEIQRYLRRCVHTGGIAALIHTGTEVACAHWTGQQWLLELADGRRDHADVLIPAVGQLAVPSIPDLPGISTFGGPAFHTARWRHDVRLGGKRVAVIGTGASAIQVIPQIAPQVRHLTVFQRSAPYVLKKPDTPYSRSCIGATGRCLRSGTQRVRRSGDTWSWSPAPSSACRCPASRTCFSCTGPTRTSGRDRSSTCSRRRPPTSCRRSTCSPETARRRWK